MKDLRLIQIYKDDLLNGEGLRNVYFFSGCSNHCPGCFSVETWEYDSSISRPWTEEDFQNLLEDSKKSYISGITLLGGDPYYPRNRKGILEICRRYKEEFGSNKTIWLYTGFTWEYLMKLPTDDPARLSLNYIDVLCEGPYIQSLKSPGKPWVGSENQRVIDVKRSLESSAIVLLE